MESSKDNATLRSIAGLLLVFVVSMLLVLSCSQPVGSSGGNESDPGADDPATDPPQDPPETPTLLRPRIGFNTGSDLTPRFQWTSVGTGVQVEIQADDDPDFSSPEYHWTGLTGTSLEPQNDMSVSTSAPVGTRYYLRIRAVDAAGNASAWSKDESGAAPHRYVNVGRFNGDFNGDGYSDIVGGAYDYSWGECNNCTDQRRGRVSVFFGDDRGSITHAFTYFGPRNHHLGYAVSFAGDVNADGYSDLLIAAPYARDADNNPVGKVYLIFGHDTTGGGFEKDIDQSGDADAVLEPWGTVRRFGISVSGAGDVNADGYSDFVIGGNKIGTNSRVSASLFLGTASAGTELESKDAHYIAAVDDIEETNWQATNRTAGNVSEHYHFGPYYGAPVSGAGDVNGDGFSDFLLAGPTRDNNAGRVFLFTGGNLSPGGGAMDPETTRTGGAGTYLGTGLAGAGDFDGDGYDDVLAGLGVNNGNQRVFLYHGGADGNLWGRTTTFPRPGDFTAYLGRFGHVAAGVGDFNGDTYDDIVIADPYSEVGNYASEAQGRIAIYYGRSDPSSSISSYDRNLRGVGASVTNGYLAEQLGTAVASPGDVDGDGLNDILVGGPNWSNFGDDFNLRHWGAVKLVYGTDGGIAVARKFHAVPGGSAGYNRTLEHFGFSVAPGW